MATSPHLSKHNLTLSHKLNKSGLVNSWMGWKINCLKDQWNVKNFTCI